MMKTKMKSMMMGKRKEPNKLRNLKKMMLSKRNHSPEEILVPRRVLLQLNLCRRKQAGRVGRLLLRE
jgi:hypothetical protein